MTLCSLSLLESLPIDLFAKIAQYLPTESIAELSVTSRTVNTHIKEVFRKQSTPSALFRFGEWYGTWDDTALYFTNGLIESIQVKPYSASDSVDFYRVFLNLKNDLSNYLAFYHHTYYASLHHWIRYYFSIKSVSFCIIIKTRLPPSTIFQIQPYKVTTTRQKRDHCNAIGITIGFHTYPPLIHPSIFQFHQRIGFNWDMDDRIYLWDDTRPLRFHLVSEITIATNAFRGNSHAYDSNNTYLLSNVDIVFTSTKCYLKTVYPSNFDDMDKYYKLIELYANTIYSLLAEVDYDKIRQEAELKRHEFSEKLRIPEKEILIDAPATLEEVWNQLQTMEIYFRYI